MVKVTPDYNSFIGNSLTHPFSALWGDNSESKKEQYKIQFFLSEAYKEVRDYAFRIKDKDRSGDNLNADIYLGITQAILNLPTDVQEELTSSVLKRICTC